MPTPKPYRTCDLDCPLFHAEEVIPCGIHKGWCSFELHAEKFVSEDGHIRSVCNTPRDILRMVNDPKSLPC